MKAAAKVIMVHGAIRQDVKGCLTQHSAHPQLDPPAAQCITYSGNLLVEAFAGVMEEVFQHFGHLEQGEARLAVALLRRVVTGRVRRPGGAQQQLLLLVLFEQQVMQEALLRDGPVELLQTAVGEELAQVDAVVHKEAHKVGLVVDQRVHHHLLQVARLGEIRDQSDPPTSSKLQPDILSCAVESVCNRPDLQSKKSSYFFIFFNCC